MTLLTTAYAGYGDISDANLDALLNQLLPDGPLGMVYIPEGTIVKRNQPGLAKVVNWLQNNENGVGVEGTIPVKNLIQAMLERNEKQAADGEDADELVLVMAYNPASGLDVSLVKEAHAAGIRVVDLGAAGDDIVPPEPEVADEPPADEEPTEPTPPPAEDNPPWEGDAAPEDLAAEHAAPKDEATQSDAGKAVARATRAAKAAVAKHEAPAAPADRQVEAERQLAAPPAAPAGTPGLVFQVQVTVAPEHVATFARAIVEAMGAQASAVVSAAPLAPVVDLPVGDRGSNKADPAGQPEGTKPYYYNAGEGKYRPARGVKRQSEERVFLTPDEIEQAKAAKMLN